MAVDQEVDAGHVLIEVDRAVGDGLVVHAQVHQTDDKVGVLLIPQRVDLRLGDRVELLALGECDLLDQTRVDLGKGFGGLHAENANGHTVDRLDGVGGEGRAAVRLEQHVGADGAEFLRLIQVGLELGIAEVELMVAQGDVVIPGGVHHGDGGLALAGGDIGGTLAEVAGIHQDDLGASGLEVFFHLGDLCKAQERAVGVVGVQNHGLTDKILLNIPHFPGEDHGHQRQHHDQRQQKRNDSLGNVCLHKTISFCVFSESPKRTFPVVSL